MSPEAAEVLRLRLAISQAATKKYAAIEARQHGARLHGLFQYRGAARTGRWAGRAVQLHNLKRPPKGQDNDAVAASLLDGTFDTAYGGKDALETLGGAIRAAIAAPDGKALVVRDLSSIESRVLGWTANDQKLQQVFKDGRDPYKDFASHWLGTPYGQITKSQRNLAKPPSLGCGYGLGPGGLEKYAASMGVEMTAADCESAVTAFRTTYGSIKPFWYWVETAFRCAIAGFPTEGYRLKFDRQGDMVVITLPSGRGLYYYKPSLDEDGSIIYWGQNQYTNKWEPIRTYGARLVENIVQAIACDILTHGMQLARSMRLPIVLHVHDEIGCEVPEAAAEAALQALGVCMDTVPVWAPGLILGSAGYIAKRYRKD